MGNTESIPKRMSQLDYNPQNKPLSEGEFGTLYLVTQKSTDKKYILKEFHKSLPNDELMK